jgi:organic radical activating enzyme
VVSELFGPTVQGEGPSAGQQAGFIRLSRCNLACSWCDTPWTWQWSRYDRPAEQWWMDVPAVLAWATAHPSPLYVVTGGEPLLQPYGLTALAAGLTGSGARVEIETNGTLVPPPELLRNGVTFNVSPKLSNAALSARRRIRPEALEVLARSGRAIFKFVVSAVDDLEEVAELEDRFALGPIWITPEATSSSQVIAGVRALADPVIARGWNLSARLHVLAWEDARGH